MAKVLVSSQYLENIADSIRDRLSVSTTYTPAQMADAISSFAEDANASASDILNGKTAYVGSQKITGNIASKSSANLTVSGATVTAPAGYYASSASTSIAAGSASTPATTITATPSISVNASGKITATVSASQAITPTVSAGYVSAGTSGTATVAGSNTSQLTTLAATTYTPTTVNQTITSGKYITGTLTIKGDTNLVASNIVSGVTIFGVTGTYSIPPAAGVSF